MIGGFEYNDKKPTTPITGDTVIENGEVLVWDNGGWIPVIPNDKHTEEELVDIFEGNPELYNRVMVEMRNRKINNITKK